jgi:NAD(P)-dependent dehydrogenase (short-subunit alcohol dehydrogenase family)
MPRFDPHPPRRPAIVTGASSGIGAATAGALAEAGHPVILGARRLDSCEELAGAIRQAGGEALALPLDLSDTGSIDKFADAATDAFGPVEVLVSNAGEIHPRTALDTEPEVFDRVVSVNLTNAHRLVATLTKPMVERRRGDLVIVTSDAVAHPRPFMAAYVASKWGLEGYARALQMELEGTGVRASVVQPGQTMTGMGFDWDPDQMQRVVDEWGRWGFARHGQFLKPKAVADAVVFCISARRGTNYTTIQVHPEAPVSDPEHSERP